MQTYIEISLLIWIRHCQLGKIIHFIIIILLLLLLLYRERKREFILQHGKSSNHFPFLKNRQIKEVDTKDSNQPARQTI